MASEFLERRGISFDVYVPTIYDFIYKKEKKNPEKI